MKQLLQDLKNGTTYLEDIPVPALKRGHLLIRTHRSLVSLGTEKMLVSFGKANWLNKARSQPEKVRQVIEKIQSDGLRPTMDAVFRKLGEPLPLGYCNAGEVIGVGTGVSGFKVGDRVVSNGAHAEVVSVPENLCAKIPDSVNDDQAAFTVIGAIALQGIRLIQPSFGETVVVSGLGLIGLLAAKLLIANGCEVIGLDVDEHKLAMAEPWDIKTINVAKQDPVQFVQEATNGTGADAVLITASNPSDEIISQSARMSRQRGRIVLVGVIGLNLQRSDFYEKELSFQVSCSYGPGRYDPQYEQKGYDYPIGFVRWTQNRNFQAILSAMEKGQLSVDELITESVELHEFEKIYGNLSKKGNIASLIKYPDQQQLVNTITTSTKTFPPGQATVGILGAGNFTRAMILPQLKKLGQPIKYLASASGLSGTIAAKKFGVLNSITDYQIMLSDPDLSAIMITTRHNAHAKQVIAALQAGKHVFVEKPLALTTAEIEAIHQAYLQSKGSLTVGFNRRFSPFSREIKAELGDAPGPINVIATMNAGFIPADSWVHDPEVGGGRIIGEACHLIDLISFFTGSTVESVVMNALGPNATAETDNASILLRYANGSQGVINYFSNGSKAYSKERIEVYSKNRTAVIDNFRRSQLYGFSGRGSKRSQDKGHYEQFSRFKDFITKGGTPPIPYDSIINASKAAIAAVESLAENDWIKL